MLREPSKIIIAAQDSSGKVAYMYGRGIASWEVEHGIFHSDITSTVSWIDKPRITEVTPNFSDVPDDPKGLSTARQGIEGVS